MKKSNNIKVENERPPSLILVPRGVLPDVYLDVDNVHVLTLSYRNSFFPYKDRIIFCILFCKLFFSLCVRVSPHDNIKLLYCF